MDALRKSQVGLRKRHSRHLQIKCILVEQDKVLLPNSNESRPMKLRPTLTFKRYQGEFVNQIPTINRID